MLRLLPVLLAPVLLVRPAWADEPIQIAVLTFRAEAEDPEHDWVGSALAQLLAGNLGRREGVVAVERERVADLLREIHLRERALIAPSEAGRIARVADADWGVFGTWRARERVVSVELTVVDAKTGKTLRSARLEGSLDDLGTLVARMTQAVFGAEEGLEPSARIPRVKVEALAAYARGLAADERGNYAKAFVELSRALRQEPTFSQAELELGKLYRRMGEPERAVVVWRHVVEHAADPDHVVQAATLASHVLRQDLDDGMRAALVLEAIPRRFPFHRDAGHTAGAIALERARAGDVRGALEYVDATIDALNTRSWGILPKEFCPSGPTQRNRYAWPMAHRGELQTSVGHLRQLRRDLFLGALRAGVEGLAVPEGVAVVGPDDRSLVLHGDDLRARHVAALPWSGMCTVVATPGFRIAAVTMEVRAGREDPDRPGYVTTSLFAAGSVEYHPPLQHPVDAAPGTYTRSVTYERAVPRLDVRVYPSNGAVTSVALEVDLVEDPGTIWMPPPPGAVPFPERAVPRRAGRHCLVQNLRFAGDASGRLHVVYEIGPLTMPFPSYGSEPDPFSRGDLWITTSEDEGRTFGTPRLLGVSTPAEQHYPALIQGRDGIWRLVWTEQRRGDQGRLRYAESADLVTWSWPRRVPLPFVADPRVGPGANIRNPGGVHAHVLPQLIERRPGLFELLATAWHGPEGAGIYLLATTDGVAWSRPRRIVGDGALGSAAPFDAEAMLVASRGEPNALRFHHVAPSGAAREVTGVASRSATEHRCGMRPVLRRARDGTLYLWDWISAHDSGLFTSSDGLTWEGPHVRIRGAVPTDVWIREDGVVLTLLEGYAGSFLHRWEGSR